MKRWGVFLTMCGLWMAASWAGVSGCETVATSEPGVFVPNVKGTYDLRNVTAACADQLDPVVSVLQEEDHLIIQPSGGSFTDLTGTIDKQGAITVTGASTVGAPFECTGQFSSDLLAGVCVSDETTCVENATGTTTCTTTSVSCSFTYERR